jgi:phage major head subunit gpT-like protein
MLTNGQMRDAAKPGFWGGFRSYPTIMERISKRVMSDNETEYYGGFGFAPPVREMKGGRDKVAVPLYEFSITNKLWENTVPIGYWIRRSDKSQLIADLLATAGRKARAYPEKLGAIVLNNNPLGYDGLALFSTSHVDASATYTTVQDNALTTNIADPTAPTDLEFAAAVRAMRNKRFTFKDGAGDAFWPDGGVDAKFVVVIPTTYMSVAEAVRDNEFLTGQVSNDMRGKFSIVVNPDLTAPTSSHGYFYLVDDGGPERPLIHQVVDEVRMEDDLGGDNEFDTKDVHFGSFAAYNVGPGNWRTIVRQDFT